MSKWLTAMPNEIYDLDVALKKFTEVLQQISDWNDWNLIASKLRREHRIAGEIIGKYLKPRYDRWRLDTLG